MLHPNTSAEVHQQLLDMAVRLGAAAYILQNKAVMARDDLRPVLPTITVPTIIIYGANDQLTPVAYGEQLRDNIRGSAFHIITDCGHLPPIERPDAVAALLRTWMTNGTHPRVRTCSLANAGSIASGVERRLPLTQLAGA